MLKDKTILCFAPSDWWGMNPSCTTHLMKHFARSNRVIYINPFSSDLIGSMGSSEGRRGLGSRIWRKLKSVFRILKKVDTSMYVMSPFFLPFQGMRWMDALNNLMILTQLKIVCLFLKVRCPIVWVENLRSADFLGHFKSDCLIYHVSDLFSDDSYTTNQSILAKRENTILDSSDIVICVSKSLYDRLENRCPNRFYIPHGVDYHLFQAALAKKEAMSELDGLDHPIAGYFGTLTSHNDIELLEYCAGRLKTFSFVFAGQITGGNYDKLKELPNVRFIGKVPYERIPQLCASIDVGLLPWKVDDWIRNCNPLKMFEYMACGKPVVSVLIREVEKYPELASVCATKEAFCESLETILKTDTPAQVESRMQLAQQHSWDKHVEKISDLIHDVFSREKS